MRLLQASKLASSIWHTRPSQLWHRVRLEVLRRSGRTARCARRYGPNVRIAEDAQAPLAVSSPTSVVDCGEGRAVRILHQDVPLTLPFDWEVSGITVGRPLGELEVHYLEWLEDLGDEDFCAYSLDWIEQNGHPVGRRPWRTSWNAYGLSIRCMSWMRGLHERGARLDPAARGAIADEVALQLGFLERNLELDLGGNHLLKDITALLAGSRFFAGPVAERWARRACALLARELPEQLLEDGLHYERSPSYHALVFLDLLECYRAMPASSQREDLWARLHVAARALVDLTHPDGGPSLFNDGGMTKAPPAAEVLQLFAACGGDVPAPREVFAFEDAGYFGLRNPSELLLVDCGPIGPDHLPAHGHGDLLAFEWSVGRRRIFVDFGVYEYTPGEWRARSRATKSHNTVTVDDADQCDFWSSFRVGRRAHVLDRAFRAAGQGFELRGSHDGFCNLPGRPVHTRRVVAEPGRVELHDEVTGGAGQPVASRLLLHPECSARLVPGGFVVQSGEVTVEGQTEAQVAIEDAT